MARFGPPEPPSTVPRSGRTGRFEFFNSAIVPGESSKFVYARSGRATYNNAGFVEIVYANGATCVVTGTFQPGP